MAATNNVLLTAFASKSIATILGTGACPFMVTSYRGVDEWNNANLLGYGASRNLSIKQYGYPTVQKGLAVTPQNIDDRAISYSYDPANDLYNITRDFNFLDLDIQVVGGKQAFMQDPNKTNSDGELTGVGKQFIDNYAEPAYVSLNETLEKTIADKMAAGAFYSVVDTPSKLKSTMTIGDMIDVEQLCEALAFNSERYAVMNLRDAASVSKTLQNMFNESINTPITRKAWIGNKGMLSSFMSWRSRNIQKHTAGEQYATSPTFTVSSATPDSSGAIKSIVFSGVASVTTRLFKAGDRIAIPSVNIIGKTNKRDTGFTLVITVASDTNGVGDGTVSVPLSEPLYATTEQQNVDSAPAGSAAAELYPDHYKNYFYIRMGVCATPLRLREMPGMDVSTYVDNVNKIAVQCSDQGLNTSGLETFRISLACATLCIPTYVVVYETI